MKFNKFLSIIGLTLVFVFSSCETTDLDLTVDPNALTEDQLRTELLFNNLQVSHARFINTTGTYAGELMRQTSARGSTYQNVYGPTTFDAPWRNAYRFTLNNARLIIEKQETEPFTEKYVAATKILTANTLITLVDAFGDVPWSEAVTPGILFPKLDNGATVYQAAETLLNEGIALVDDGAGNAIVNDVYFGSNMARWKTLANTLKMKIYYQTRLVDANAVSKFEAIVSSGNYINANADNFVFNWGSSNPNPDSRHPWYSAHYGLSGAADIGFYMSNYLMDLMRNTYSVSDPRMAYYFYRQRNAVQLNTQFLACAGETRPTHYPADMAFCVIDNGLTEGWWGTDHMRVGGIPQDTPRRTLVGIYPAGGRIDDNAFSPINGLIFGANGFGITPMILASNVDFWRAEMSLFGGTGDFNTLVLSGVNKSITYVQSFSARSAATFNAANLPQPAQISTYVAEITNRLNASTSLNERMELLAEQFIIATYGNGLDAYAAYRRTGYPKNIQLALEPNPGPFMRTFWYPDNEASSNPNINQKSNLTVQTFWDNNPIQGFLQNN